MADTTKNTQETGTTNPNPSGSVSGASSYGSKTPEKQFGQSSSATAARPAREQYPNKDRESESSFASAVDRGVQKGAEAVDYAKENMHEVYDRASEVYDRASQRAGEAYDRASRGVTEGWDNAVDYGRKNPGTATLIAFGAGIGIGLLLANTANQRSRSQRIVPPIMNALSEIASELFR